MQVEVLHNQSLLDISIQHTGSVENCFQIALANGLAVSDELAAGMMLVIPESVVNDADVLAYFKNKKMMPATALTTAQQDATTGGPLGIGYMKIGTDFIVS